MSLYFISLIPPPEVESEVHALKQEMSRRFNSSKALRLPAHITLQIPFRFPEEEEDRLFTLLETFSRQQQPFEIQLSGFGSFPPRVIFIKVKNPDPVTALFKALRQTLYPEIELKQNEKMDSIHPHMTIAFRDLTPEAFAKAWPELQQRNLNPFLAQKISTC